MTIDAYENIIVKQLRLAKTKGWDTIMDYMEDYLDWENDITDTVMRQEDNGKSWYVRVEDVTTNRIDVPKINSNEWYEPETTEINLT